MAPTADSRHGDGWRLGGDSAESHTSALQAPGEPPGDRSLFSLERPIAVVTVERMAWGLIALWAVLTRLIALDARPLSSSEARNALFEYDLTHKTALAAAVGFQPLLGGWLHLLEAGFFAVTGSGDFSARLVFALSGLLIVAMAFMMRGCLGRAGAIALGMMLTISPSVTYFSRSASTVVPALAMFLVALALFINLIEQPGRRPAIRLGFVVGLMVAVGFAGIVGAGSSIVALALIGLWLLISQRNAYLGVRVWIDRYTGLAVLTLLIAAVVITLSESVLPDVTHRIQILPGQAVWGLRGFASGFAFYAPPLALYEFLIIVLSTIGALFILAGRIRSRFAWWCLIWAATSVAVYLWIPLRAPGLTVAMVVPATFVGAIGIEHLHHSNSWRYLRFPLAALGLLTIYVQLLSNFVYLAPDASEAQWSRHANLAWREGATTLQAYEHCREITKQLAATPATVYFRGTGAAKAPALRWYLRSLTAARDPESAAVIVDVGGSAKAVNDADDTATYAFDAELGWWPSLSSLDTTRTLRYVLTAEVWEPIMAEPALITLRATGASSPTIIMTPGTSR
jgi:uncharacterized protein (TIGR03663 family)